MTGRWRVALLGVLWLAGLAACGATVATPGATVTGGTPGRPTIVLASPIATATPGVAATPATPGIIAAILGTSFNLPAGRTALVAPDGLAVTFLRVVEDSRCPRNVTCVWAGELVAELAVARGGQALGTVRLSTIDANASMERPTVADYHLALLAASPPREMIDPGSTSAQMRPIAPGDYAIQLLVTRVSGGIAPADRAVLDQRVQIRYDQTAQFAPEGLTLRFTGPVGETRCPKSATIACATSGTATVQLAAAQGTAAATLALTIPGLTDDTTALRTGPVLDAARVIFAGYRVQLIGLEPQPTGGGKPPVGDYVVVVIVTRP